MAVTSVELYGKVRRALGDLVIEIDHGESLYSAEGIDEIKVLADDLISACEQYSRAVQGEEDDE